ncbi:MAG: hypothetical protein K6F69_10185, partial [Treponema sp.]|nr:hypothetical protein [Treponema sp.]
KKKVLVAVAFINLVFFASYAESFIFPLEFDLYTEPQESANTTNGMLQYNWNESYSSRLDIKYTTDVETLDEIDGYTNAVETVKEKTFEAYLYPLKRYFGSREYDSFVSSVATGLFYQYTTSDTFAGMFDTNGRMLDEVDTGKYFTMENKRKAHFLGPVIAASAKYDIGDYVSFNYEASLSPIYYIILDHSLSYYSDQTSSSFDYSDDNTYSSWSTPFIEQKFYIDLMKRVRLLAKCTYQKINTQQIDWNADGDLSDFDDEQDLTTFRVGFEYMSQKFSKSRISAGLYYENSWVKSEYNDNTVHDSKWIFSIGAMM